MSNSSMEFHQTDTTHLRPVDVMRDMPTVLDLIEIGFESELDPQGWKLLNQMRNVTRQAGILSLQSALRSESAGFVWVEDGDVVANLSLRIALPGATRGRLIGNVVVHPDYRGRGIGRALLEAAVKAARSEDSRWIGLEVREQNKVACGIYQRFGFRNVGSIYHLLRRADLPWPEDAVITVPWRKSQPYDKNRWVALADTVYGHYQKRVLEIRDYQFAYGGFKQWVNLWLKAERQSAWLHNNDNPRYAVCVKTDRRYRFHVWDILMHADEDEAGARDMVAKAFSLTNHFPPWPVIALVADQEPLVAEMNRAGFHVHRTLLQMVLEL